MLRKDAHGKWRQSDLTLLRARACDCLEKTEGDASHRFPLRAQQGPLSCTAPFYTLDIQVRIHVCCFRLLHCIQHLLQQPWVVHVCSLEFYDDIFVGPGKEFQKAPGEKDLSLATPRCVRPCRSFVNQLAMYAYISPERNGVWRSSLRKVRCCLYLDQVQFKGGAIHSNTEGLHSFQAAGADSAALPESPRPCSP